MIFGSIAVYDKANESGDEIRRLYKAGTVPGGDKVYVIDAFEKLTPHLLAWGEKLRADGVLF